MHPMAFVIGAVGWFALSLVDIAATFVLVRVLVMKWPTKWLLRFDEAGRPLVDGMFAVLDRKIHALWNRTLRAEARPLVCLLALLVVRVMLGSMVVMLAR
jgi:hypothetical protein